MSDLLDNNLVSSLCKLSGFVIECNTGAICSAFSSFLLAFTNKCVQMLKLDELSFPSGSIIPLPPSPFTGYFLCLAPGYIIPAG